MVFARKNHVSVYLVFTKDVNAQEVESDFTTLVRDVFLNVFINNFSDSLPGDLLHVRLKDYTMSWFPGCSSPNKKEL